MNASATVWLLVADEAIARLLEVPEDGGDPLPVEELTDPAAHARNADLRRDAYGRRNGTATSSAGLDASHREAEQFAARVAACVAERLQQRRFGRLHVAAAPRFLGLLRKAWTKPVQLAIGTELDKDLIHATEFEIAKQFKLDPFRPPAA